MKESQSPQHKVLQIPSHQTDAVKAEMTGSNWRIDVAITGKQPVPAPKPTELLLGALGVCMISGIQREAAVQGLKVDDVRVDVQGTRVMAARPRLEDIRVQVDVFSKEPEAKLRPILEALNNNGTVTNTLKSGQPITIEYAIIAA